jgi:hypothetical protein
MIKGVSIVLVAGGLLAGMVTPQVARADGPDELVAFVAGTAVGYLLNADRDVHHVHHHGYAPPAYVVQHRHYGPPPVQVVHYHERPRYHVKHHHKHHRKHYRKHGGRGRYGD